MFKKAVENSDNKVQIAMQMYEMVRSTVVNSGTKELALNLLFAMHPFTMPTVAILVHIYYGQNGCHWRMHAHALYAL